MDAVRQRQRIEYEKERREELQERRKEWHGKNGTPTVEQQFGPGTMGCHEAFHVSNMIVEMIQKELIEHSAVLIDPEWYALVQEAQDSLYQAYLHAGRLHHNAPKEGEPANSPRFVGMPKVKKTLQ
jgi:hypothetical protein